MKKYAVYLEAQHLHTVEGKYLSIESTGTVIKDEGNRIVAFIPNGYLVIPVKTDSE